MAEGGDPDRESKDRRLFLDEAHRRILSLLCDLRAFADRYGVFPPPWAWVRLAALGEQVIDDGAPIATGVLEETIAGVELEIRCALAELASSLELDQPIPYRVLEPLPPPPRLRPYLAVVRGGRA